MHLSFISELESYIPMANTRVRSLVLRASQTFSRKSVENVRRTFPGDEKYTIVWVL